MSIKLVCDQCNVEIPDSNKSLHVEAQGQKLTKYDYCVLCACLVMSALTVKRETIDLGFKLTRQSLSDWIRGAAFKHSEIQLIHLPSNTILHNVSVYEADCNDIARVLNQIAKNHAAGLFNQQKYAVMIANQAYYFCLQGQKQ
jgi:hypothetical protein